MGTRSKHVLSGYYSLCLLLLLRIGVYAQTLPEAAMYAHFIDVGQADATLLEFPTGAVLIDAGAQDPEHRSTLLKYLRNFFQRRVNLHNTLDLVLITHCHIDHDFALDSIVANFKIRNYIDNGVKTGSGKKNQLWMERNATSLGVRYRSYTFEQTTAAGCDGLTDSVISPVNTGAVHPVISLLSGRFAKKPANWKTDDFNNGNNHSLVIKVSFGRASFLFTGDLETAAIKSVLNAYSNCTVLDVDVLRVGHHGAENATTPAFLQAVTPLTAVISCGQWNFGQGPPPKNFTTFAYGHPRANTLDALEAVIPGNRAAPLTIHAGIRGKAFVIYTVHRNIYDTAWDHHIILQADSDGKYYLLHQ